MNVRHGSLMAKAFDRAWIIAKAGKDWINMSPDEYKEYKDKIIAEHLDATNREETCCEEMEERVLHEGATPDYEFCPYCGDYVTQMW